MEQFKFIKTCQCYPEQYNVLNNNNDLVGYVRLRGGHLAVYYPDVDGEKIYEHYFDDDCYGEFSSDKEREEYLRKINERINEVIARGNLATNRMIMMFCSKGIGEWTNERVQCTGNQWSYCVGDEDEPVSESLRVRTWDSLEWSIPTKDYIEQLLRGM